VAIHCATHGLEQLGVLPRTRPAQSRIDGSHGVSKGRKTHATLAHTNRLRRGVGVRDYGVAIQTNKPHQLVCGLQLACPFQHHILIELARGDSHRLLRELEGGNLFTTGQEKNDNGIRTLGPIASTRGCMTLCQGGRVCEITTQDQDADALRQMWAIEVLFGLDSAPCATQCPQMCSRLEFPHPSLVRAGPVQAGSCSPAPVAPHFD
jgi:hypothetical protein